MPLPQHLPHLLQAIALGGEQDDVVIHQIGRFAEKQVAVVVFGFDDELDGFLAYFLRNFIDAPGQ